MESQREPGQVRAGMSRAVLKITSEPQAKIAIQRCESRF